MALMEFTVHGRDIAVTDALKAHADKKLQRLTRFFRGIKTADVVLSVQGGEHICEVTVPLPGAILRAEARTRDMYVSIDEVAERLRRQIQHYRKRFAKNGKGVVEQAENRESESEEIVRQKRIPLKPMLPDEAVMQLNLVGHDFFVFLNGETSQVNVIYRRLDGKYGLLEPDV